MNIDLYHLCIPPLDIYDFNFDGAVGRHLRIIQRSKNELLNIAEVKVNKAPALATGTPYEHKYIKPGNDTTTEYVTGEAHIPCGVCAVVDYKDGDTVEIPRGINVEGMLYFPPTANVELRTPHVYVQGKLKVDAPNDGNKIKVHMIDTAYEQFMIPHVENAGACSVVGCSFGKKAVGVAGGTSLPCANSPLMAGRKVWYPLFCKQNGGSFFILVSFSTLQQDEGILEDIFWLNLREPVSHCLHHDNTQVLLKFNVT